MNDWAKKGVYILQKLNKMETMTQKEIIQALREIASINVTLGSDPYTALRWIDYEIRMAKALRQRITTERMRELSEMRKESERIKRKLENRPKLIERKAKLLLQLEKIKEVTE